MSHTFEELKHKKVSELREIAAGLDHEELQGYTQLNKEHLLAALCKALKIDMHVHHEVVGVDKTKIKQNIRALKKQRDEALETQDHHKLKLVRRKIRHFKKN